MKKICSFLLTVVMLLSLCVSACAEGNLLVSKVYADMYGVEITFNQDVENVTLPEIILKNSGTVINFTESVKKSTAYLSAELPRDTVLTLSVGDSYTVNFMVESIFYEDFSNITKQDAQAKFNTTSNSLEITADGKMAVWGKSPIYPEASTGNLEDYTVSFDTQMFSINSAPKDYYVFYNSSGKSGVPIDASGFVADETTSYRAFTKSLTTKSEKWADVDGTRRYKDFDSEFTVFPYAKVGSNGQYQAENCTKTVDRLGNADETGGSLPETVKFTVKKHGKEAALFLDGYRKNEFIVDEVKGVSSLSPVVDDDLRDKGYFGIFSDYTNGWRNCTLYDNFVITKYTEVNLEIMSISSLYADKESVTLTFDKQIPVSANVSDITLSLNDTEVPVNCTINRNKAVIKPQSGEFKLDTAYDINVPAGFGSAMTKTDTSYFKQFKIKTLFSEDFSSLTDASQKFNGGTIVNNRLVLYNSTVYPKVDLPENYSAYITGTFYNYQNYKMVPEFLINADTTSGSLGNAYGIMLDNEEAFEKAYIEGSGIQLRKWSSADTNTVYYNAMTGGNFKKVNNGTTDAQNVNATLTGGDSNTYKIEKIGQDALFKANGYVINIFNAAEAREKWSAFTQESATGALAISANWQGVCAFDNILITASEILNSEVSLGKVNVSADIGTLPTVSTVSGDVTVKNYTDDTKNYTLVVAVYGEYEEMLDAVIIKNNANLGAYARETYDYSFTGLTGAVNVKAFLWDSFINILPYCDAFDFSK